MASKQAHKDFSIKIHDLVMSLGAVYTNTRYKYTLETKAGELLIDVRDVDFGDVFSILCKFEDTDKANDFITKVDYNDRLNRFSGKWNFHCFIAEQALNKFKNEIQKIL